MVCIGGHSDRITAYAQLSMWERQVLSMWIAHLDLSMIWGYTSLGLAELFEESELGFPITHPQFQQAMLRAGYRVHTTDGDIWLFDPPLGPRFE